MTTGGLFDPGLQPERTDLAWRRTVVALMVGALLAARLLPPVLGLWSYLVGLGGVAAATSIWIRASRRARQTQEALRNATGVLPDAGLLLGLAIVVSTGAAFGLLYVLLVTS